jgi:hypothetical protein
MEAVVKRKNPVFGIFPVLFLLGLPVMLNNVLSFTQSLQAEAGI